MPSSYETDALLAQYLLLHYGAAAEVLPYSFGPREALDFPLRCIRDTGIVDGLPANARALEVGCAVGRASFELARHCTQVIGIDASESFITVANHLKNSGFHEYEHPLEGSLQVRAVAAVPADIDRSRVRFEQGDAQQLPSSLGQFDLVVACNLICRLPEPRRFLQRLKTLVRPGGRLLLTTPFSWLEQYTAPANWLGGDAARGSSFNGLRSALEADFTLEDARDLPFLIREHARKYQWGVSQVSFWIKK